MHALSAEQLIALGKTAAKQADSSGIPLTDAVVRSVGMTKLNSEQIRRIVEAANHEAFDRKFASMSADMRVVELNGGPANPEAVIERLNAAALPTKVAHQMNTNDYLLPPSYAPAQVTPDLPNVKEAAAESVHSLRDLAEKLATATSELKGIAAAREVDLHNAILKVASVARTAVSSGAYHEDFERAWGATSPKIARELLPHLNLPRAPDHVKIASRVFSDDSEVVTAFIHTAKCADAYEAAHLAAESMQGELDKTTTFLRGVS